MFRDQAKNLFRARVEVQKAFADGKLVVFPLKLDEFRPAKLQNVERSELKSSRGYSSISKS